MHAAAIGEVKLQMYVPPFERLSCKCMLPPESARLQPANVGFSATTLVLQRQEGKVVLQLQEWKGHFAVARREDSFAAARREGSFAAARREGSFAAARREGSFAAARMER